MLDIKNLHVSIEDHEILKGVDLHIAPGEFVGVVGRIGAADDHRAAACPRHPPE